MKKELPLQAIMEKVNLAIFVSGSGSNCEI